MRDTSHPLKFDYITEKPPANIYANNLLLIDKYDL